MGRRGRPPPSAERSQRVLQRLPGSLVAAPRRRRRYVEQHRRFGEREAVPVDESDEFGQIAVEPVDGVPEFESLVGRRRVACAQCHPETVGEV